jgi:hypothetical protein
MNEASMFNETTKNSDFGSHTVSTLVVVKQLFRPELLVEVDAIAVAKD